MAKTIRLLFCPASNSKKNVDIIKQKIFKE
jgi:hypothetical protein